MLKNIDWRSLYIDLVTQLENRMQISVCVNEAILLLAVRKTEESLGLLGIEQPNVAKIAGFLVFWLRKLKPLSLVEGSPNYYDLINEKAAVTFGMSICGTYFDDMSREDGIQVPDRIIQDWIVSLRYHSHSPHSIMTTFEVMACIA